MPFDAEYIRLLKERARAYNDRDEEAFNRQLSNIDDEVLLKAVTRLGRLNVDPHSGTDMRAIPVPRKMEINHLGDKAKRLIESCLCHSKQIAAFVKSCNRTDPDFAGALRTYICDLYASLLRIGFAQDDLLVAMKSHMEEVGGDVINGAALTTIVVHMFLVCDIFKKSNEEGERRLRRESGI